MMSAFLKLSLESPGARSSFCFQDSHNEETFFLCFLQIALYDSNVLRIRMNELVACSSLHVELHSLCNEALSFIEAFHALLGDLALFPTTLIDLHFQVLGVSPLHTHFAIVLLFFMATIVRRIAYMEIKLRPQDAGSVVVRTYPAEGPINPLHQFAKRLASKGLKATLATTHYSVKSIHATTVGVEPISNGYDDGGYKQTPSTEAYLESFKSAGSKTLSELISKFKDSDSPVNCIVYDSLLPWALDVARQFGIYGAVFLTNSASVCSMNERSSEENGGLRKEKRAKPSQMKRIKPRTVERVRPICQPCQAIKRAEWEGEWQTKLDIVTCKVVPRRASWTSYWEKLPLYLRDCSCLTRILRLAVGLSNFNLQFEHSLE
uniref:Uncharacterized protein n=1 Tax=Quercus lobata TaxID=97700 RepID=A0A7N2MP34_QUELO